MSGVMGMDFLLGFDVKKTVLWTASGAYIAALSQTKGAACFQPAPPIVPTRISEPAA